MSASGNSALGVRFAARLVVNAGQCVKLVDLACWAGGVAVDAFRKGRTVFDSVCFTCACVTVPVHDGTPSMKPANLAHIVSKLGTCVNRIGFSEIASTAGNESDVCAWAIRTPSARQKTLRGGRLTRECLINQQIHLRPELGRIHPLEFVRLQSVHNQPTAMHPRPPRTCLPSKKKRNVGVTRT